MNLPSALDRVTRTLIVSIGIGSVLFTLLGLPTIIRQHSTLQPVFSIAAVVLFCGLPPVMALLSFRVEVPVLRVLAGVHAVVTLVLLALLAGREQDAAATAADQKLERQRNRYRGSSGTRLPRPSRPRGTSPQTPGSSTANAPWHRRHPALERNPP